MKSILLALCLAFASATAFAEEPKAKDAAEVAPEATLVNLNTASTEELTSIKGIGQKKAEDILAWRAEHGCFAVVDQLTEIKGIGPKMLEKIRPFVKAEGCDKPAEEVAAPEADKDKKPAKEKKEKKEKADKADKSEK